MFKKSTLVFTYSTRYFVRMTKLIVAFRNFANEPKKTMKAGIHKPWAPGHPDRLLSGRCRLTYVGFQYVPCFTLLFWRLEI